MKKIVYFIPAIIFTLLCGLIGIGGGFSLISLFAYGYIVAFIISGILLSKSVFWGGVFGMIPGVHTVYLGTKDTNQIFNEMPIGFAIVAFYLLCCVFVFVRNMRRAKQP